MSRGEPTAAISLSDMPQSPSRLLGGVRSEDGTNTEVLWLQLCLSIREGILGDRLKRLRPALAGRHLFTCSD